MKQVIFKILILTLLSFYWAKSQNLESLKDMNSLLLDAEKDSWESRKINNEIEIRYRNLILFDTIYTRELKATFLVENTNLKSIIKQIKTPKNITSWNSSIKTAELLKDENNSWILHTVYDIPFPFSNQDLVASYTIKKHSNFCLINSRSVPNYISTKKNVNRIEKQYSQWKITSIRNNEFQIIFSAISLSNNHIPRFLKDPIVQRSLFKAFEKFKSQL